MCGRFTLTVSMETLAEIFDVEATGLSNSRFNIAPTQSIAVIRKLSGDAGHQLDNLCWGLIPRWSKDVKIGARMINARSETLSEKSSFKGAFKKRRCIIPASGFFEWKKRAAKVSCIISAARMDS